MNRETQQCKKILLSGILLLVTVSSADPSIAASTTSLAAACLNGIHTQLDDLRNQIRTIDNEPDTSSGISATGFIVAGDCTRSLAAMDGNMPGTVPPNEADKAERKACLELQQRKLMNACQCRAAGDTSAPNDASISGAVAARKRFANLRSRVTAFGIKDPAIRGFVDAASQIQECLSMKSMQIMDRVSDAIEASIMSDGAPDVTPIYGAQPTVSAINGGPPPITAVDGGVRYAPPDSSSSTISGDTKAPSSYSSSGSTSSGSSDYRTSGAGTNAAKDIITFADAYAKSSASLHPVTPAPHISAPMPHISAPAPRVSSPAPVYRGSGISGLKH